MKMIAFTFDQAMSNDTYGMRVHSHAPLEPPPSQFVALDRGSFVSDEEIMKIKKQSNHEGGKKKNIIIHTRKLVQDKVKGVKPFLSPLKTDVA